MYFYKGTTSTPPCDKNVDWLVLKNPMVVSKDDFSALKKNVFQFREEDEGRGNTNRYMSIVSQIDLDKGNLLK